MAMNYLDSIADFFKSPKWMTNLLLAGVCAFIPIVGPMVVYGWLITGFWSRPRSRPETFPPFDFAHFGKWLERGLWPMLIALVTGMGISLVFMIPMGVLMALGGAFAGTGGRIRPETVRFLGSAGLIAMIALQAVVMVLMILILKPLMLRASLTQDFVQAFNLRFLRRFVALTWVELLLSSLFAALASWLLMLVGLLAFCVGVVLVPGITYFMMNHLDRQLYHLYLSRGGEPVPISPKLNEVAG